MSYGNASQSIVDVIRELREDVDNLKKDMGATRLNSIRLGNWVLETVDDSLVQMTNLTTGEVSFIGGVGEGGSGDTYVVSEFPPFSIGGVLRLAFGNTIITNIYIVPSDVTITKIDSTIGYPSNQVGPYGPRYRIYRNGDVVYTSPYLITNYLREEVDIAFEADDVVYMEFFEEGSQYEIGMTSILRR